MQALALAIVLLLAGCGGVSHPLAYTNASDPMWPLNSDKWAPGGNNLVQPPAVSSGRIPQVSN